MNTKNILFCNIGWMSLYEGRKGKLDKIVGGGRQIELNGHANEVCNFLACSDGYMYGHVETIGRKIHIENIGANENDDYVDGVTVVWIARNPEVGGRYVVGWYENARVYRERQSFDPGSEQHRRDKIDNYRIVAKASDATLVSIKNRSLSLGRGKGWMGRNQWWYAQESAKKYKAVASFLGDVARFMVSRA